LGGDFSMVHATFDSPHNWGYVQSKMEAAASFTYQTAQVCFHGHTHVPMAFIDDRLDITAQFYDNIEVTNNKRYFVNVGSVGQPRDGDHRAAYVIYDSENAMIQLHRLEYDLDKAQEKIRVAGLPERLAERLSVGK